jgi:hypothetical protein
MRRDRARADDRGMAGAPEQSQEARSLVDCDISPCIEKNGEVLETTSCICPKNR